MKKLLLIAFLLFSLPAYGEDRFYEIGDFSGGLQSQISPYLTPKNSATEALNVRINEEVGAVSKRSKMLELNSCRAAPVKSLHRYYKSDDTKHLLTTASTYLDLVDEDDGDCTELKSGLTEGRRFSWVTYKDIAIGTNGSDNIIKYDGKTNVTANTIGARTAGNLAADLGAPFAQLATGSDLDTSSWYQYKVAFYDGTTYKYSNARSNPIQTGSSVRNIALTGIPLGPAGTTQRIVYRTEGQASKSAVLASTSFYKVATIANNSAREYSDAITDATILGDSAPTWTTVSAGIDVTPPKARFLLIHKERLFAANDPSGVESGRSTVYWTPALHEEYFNSAVDYEVIRPDDGDEITFIKNLNGILTIGKTNTIQKIYTEAVSSDSWTISDPFSYVGCDAPYSVVNAGIGIIYKSRNGLYSFNGQSAELLSDTVTDKIRDILVTNSDDIVGVYQGNQYLMAYTSASSGSVNNKVLILDTVRNAYVEDDKSIDSFVVFDSGDDYGTLYSGSSLADGKIFSHTGSFNNFVIRYKSELEEGSVDSVTYLGTETDPSVELGWGVTVDSVIFDGLTQAQVSALYPGAIADRPKTTGYWYSPIIQISANNLDQLFWNEELGSFGDITFAVRTGTSLGAVSAASWSDEFSDSSGSDISALTASNYIQLRAKLSTSDITSTPKLVLENSYLIKITYTKEGSEAEASVLSIWTSGYSDLEGGNFPKVIKEIQVYYTGTQGTLNVAYANDQGNTNEDFDIDLSQNPQATTTDSYYGTMEEKIFVHIPGLVERPTGRKFKFTLSDNGTTEWKVRKIVVRYEPQEYIPIR